MPKKAVKKAPKKKKVVTAKRATRSSTATAKRQPLKNLEWYKTKLEEMQADLLRLINKKREEATPENEVGDEADVAVANIQRDIFFELSGNERHILEEVEAALRRIEKGTYGICEGTGKPISIARLKAVPYARYCIEYQTRFEKR